MLYVFIAIGILIVAFIWWRYTSVERGARQRDEKLMVLLQPIAKKLSGREPVTAEEIATVSRQPQYRPMLYQGNRRSPAQIDFPPPLRRGYNLGHAYRARGLGRGGSHSRSGGAHPGMTAWHRPRIIRC